MVLSKCYGCAKYSLFFINFIFWVEGLAAFVLVVWLLSDQMFVLSPAHAQDNFYMGAYILLFFGILKMIIAFMGCAGAIRSSQCILVSAFSCLLVLFVARVVSGVWLSTNIEGLNELAKSSLMDTVKNKYGIDQTHTTMMDTFQSHFECCGATGPEDWAGSKYAINHSSVSLSLTVSGDATDVYKVPESCCNVSDSVLCKTSRNFKLGGIISPTIHSGGCMDILIGTLNSLKNILIGIYVAMGALELLGMILSLVLYCGIGSSDRYKA